MATNENAPTTANPAAFKAAVKKHNRKIRNGEILQKLPLVIIKLLTIGLLTGLIIGVTQYVLHTREISGALPYALYVAMAVICVLFFLLTFAFTLLSLYVLVRIVFTEDNSPQSAGAILLGFFASGIITTMFFIWYYNL